MNYKDLNKPVKGIVIGAGCFAIIGAIYFVTNVAIPHVQEQRRIQAAAELLEKQVAETQALVKAEASRHLQAEGETSPRRDSWGNALHYHYEADEHGKLALAVSLGPDGTENTADDIVEEAVDVNKTRMVGEWIGTRSKEAIKGIWDGLKSKAGFKSEDTKDD